MRLYYFSLLAVVAIALVSSDHVSATTSERLLRGQEHISDNVASQVEERAISDLAKSAKAWARNTKLARNVKAWSDENKLAKTMKLLNKGASFKELYKRKLKPDDVYKALRLKNRVREAFTTGEWGSLLKSDDYLKWQGYHAFWNLAQKGKNA